MKSRPELITVFDAARNIDLLQSLEPDERLVLMVEIAVTFNRRRPSPIFGESEEGIKQCSFSDWCKLNRYDCDRYRNNRGVVLLPVYRLRKFKGQVQKAFDVIRIEELSRCHAVCDKDGNMDVLHFYMPAAYPQYKFFG